MKRNEFYNQMDEMLNNATSKYYPEYEENVEKCKKFFECYDIFIDVCNECDAISFEIETEDYGNRINLILECGYFEVQEKMSNFSQLISKSKSVEFTCSDNDTTLINFEFDGIWDKVK